MYYRNIYIFIFLFFQTILVLCGQSDNWLNNLKKEEAMTSNYEKKLMLRASIAFEMIDFNIDNAKENIFKILKEAEKNNFLIVKAEAHRVIAEVFRAKGISMYSLEHDLKSIAIYESLNHLEGTLKSKRGLALSQSALSKFTSAQKMLDECVNLYQKNKIEDREYAITLHALGINTLRRGNYTNATHLFKKSLKIFQKIKDKKYELKAKNSLGLVKKNIGLYYASLQYYLEALNDINKIGTENRTHILLLTNLANLYIHRKDTTHFQEAFLLYKKANKIATEIKDSLQMSFSLEGLARYEIHYKNYKQAEKYYWQGYDLIKRFNNYIEEGYFLLRISNAYVVFKEPDKAIKNTQISIDLFNKYNNIEALSQAYAQMSSIYSQKKEYQKSQEWAFKALNLAKNSEFTTIPTLYSMVLNNYVVLKDYNNADKWAKQTINHFESVNYKEALVHIYKTLFQLDTLRKDYAKAIYWLDKHQKLKDSLSEVHKNNEIIDVQAKYNLSEQQKENLYLKKINQLHKQEISQRGYTILIVSLSLVLILFILFILIKQRGTLKKTLFQLNQTNQEVNEKKTEIERIMKDLKLINQQATEKNQQLEELNEVKNRVFSLVSHDMRGPLGNLKAVLNLIEAGHLTPQEEKDIMQQLNIDVTRTYDFLQNLLIWAKSQMEGFAPTIDKVNVRGVVKKVFAIAEVQANKKNVKIKNQIPKNINIFADEDILNIVLVNLISNAIKFTNPSGEIFIISKIQNSEVIIGVQDNGVGIADENKEKIFSTQKFTTYGTQNEKGTGFGLSMCKDLIETLGGKMWFESQLGQGTTFFIKLTNYDN